MLAGYLFSARKPNETPASAMNGSAPSTLLIESAKIAHAEDAIASIPAASQAVLKYGRKAGAMRHPVARVFPVSRPAAPGLTDTSRACPGNSGWLRVWPSRPPLTGRATPLFHRPHQCCLRVGETR